jgi:hypothetical protein
LNKILTSLHLDNSEFSSSLKIFSKFENLKTLKIENNYFFGSLEPLKNLVKLIYLNISNTNIDSGLEYLPNDIYYFACSFDHHKRKGNKVGIIERELVKVGAGKINISTGENFSSLLKL